MTNFLILISFILNIIALFSVIILFLRQNRLANVESKQEKLIHEMEETISSYLMQMKDENEIFMKKLKNLENQRITPLQNKEVFIDSIVDEKIELPLKNSEHKRETPANGYTSASVYQATKAYKQSKVSVNDQPSTNEESDVSYSPPMPDEKDNIEEQNSEIHMDSSEFQTQLLLNQATLLKKQGYSTEDIARKLNKGKTEIELLLKFQQNKIE